MGEKCPIGEACARDTDCTTNECHPTDHVCYDSRCIDPPGSQVVTIGDSYMNFLFGNSVPAGVQALARAEGSLPANESFRNYEATAATFASGQISSQFTSAVNADPAISVLIMTGGGDDVLLDANCNSGAPTPSNACGMTVQAVVDELDPFLKRAKTAGVDHIIFFFYPHVSSAQMNVVLDYAYPKVQAVCTANPPCHFIDLRPVFEGHAWINSDGIHPTADGTAAIADAIWDVMQAECILQR